MNESAYDLRSGETHIEVHKFYTGAILVVSLVALVFQAMAPVYVPRLEILEVPLLVTIYFGLSRRNPSTGLLLGMIIGLAQDALSGPTVPLGFYGIAKTIIGFLASSIGARLMAFTNGRSSVLPARTATVRTTASAATYSRCGPARCQAARIIAFQYSRGWRD